MIGWSEYGTAGLPPNSVIQAWTFKTQEEANSIIKNNAKVILSPDAKTYIPQKQDNAQEVGPAWACGGPCTLEDHYDWDPATHLPGIGDARILGMETVHWGEFMRTMDQTENFQYPRTLATAEVGWSPQAKRDYANFTQRAGTFGGRMDLEGINYFKTSGVDWSTAPAAPETAPALVDPATLPEVSPVDLGVPSTEFDGGEYLILKNLPVNAWLRTAIQNTSATEPTAPKGQWVRSNEAGEAPLEVPTGLEGGNYVVTVQNAAGQLAGFAALALAEEAAPETTKPATAPATTAPATTEPTNEATEEATTDPTDEATTAPATTDATLTSPATGDTGTVPTRVTTSPTASPTGTSADELASTGASSTLLMGGAVLALLAGLVIMAGSRRRSSQH